MTRQSSVFRFLRKFRTDEGGSVAVETLMMVPLLAWAMLATLAYFDAYRAEAISQKAGLTIADMYSRESGFITPDYINGSRDLLRFLTLADDHADLRVSVLTFNEADDKYQRVWSKNRGAGGNLKNSDMADLRPRLPIIRDGEHIIVVETWTDYSAPYVAAGLSDIRMDTFHVISPRFTDRLCWNPDEDDPDDLDGDSVC